LELGAGKFVNTPAKGATRGAKGLKPPPPFSHVKVGKKDKKF